MTKEMVKEAYNEAQKSLRNKQVEEVKQIVLKTLEKIEALKKEKEKAQQAVKDIEEKVKILKMDIDDLKEGRLDRIEERQEKDEKAKATSVVIIIKEKEVVREYPPWYWPWRVIWQTPIIIPFSSDPTYTDVPRWTTTTASGSDNYTCYLGPSSSPEINCSAAKWGTVGTYSLASGTTINIR